MKAFVAHYRDDEFFFPRKVGKIGEKSIVPVTSSRKESYVT